MTRSAEYVVVGSGSAGAIIARRLADNGARVVLLEAGGQGISALTRLPGMMGAMHSAPQLQRLCNWKHYTAPQTHALGRRIPATHGKALGGSSSVNGMIFVRGNRKNYDDWAAEGCAGWSYEQVLPYFKKFESFEDGVTDYRGGNGPIKVTRSRDVTPATERFLDALSETAGVKHNDDYNGAEQEGAALVQQSTHSGRRYSTKLGYLDTAPANLEILTGAHVTRLIIRKGRVRGVEYATRKGREVVWAECEVVVSSGVFGTPQLLMLSGVGPSGHLNELGIETRADLPVGANLQDHLFVPMTFATDTGRVGNPASFAKAFVNERLKPNRTWLARSLFEALGFVRSPYAADIPDLQLHVLPFAYPHPNQDAPVMHAPVANAQALTVLSTLIYPQSRGTVRLASSDPLAAPIIDPNYLSEPRDTDVLLAGMELIRDTMANEQIARHVRSELAPGRAVAGSQALRRDLPNRATTVYHPVGTCRMGTDDRAVVDPELRVLGIEGLRVADASIMPSITGGNTNAPTMMIGEYAADLILAGVKVPVTRTRSRGSA